MPNSSHKKKIVLLTDCLAYLTGGAERQIFELAKRLDKDKYAVTIASLECEGQAPREEIGPIGCRLEVFPVRRIYSLSGILEGLRFVRFIRNQATDILITYHFSSDIWGAFFGHLAGLKTIISNRRDMGFWRKRRHIWAYRIINRWVSKVIVVADAVGEMVCREENIPPEKVELIRNGVDLDGITELSEAPHLRKEFGLKREDLLVMHVANLTPVKGHIYLLRAFAEILKEHSNIRLFLIGADEMDGNISRLTEQWGLQDKVFFLGARKDVPQLLKMADICVLPSLSEGMSNAILEYMASGKAVVATNAGGNPELIRDGFNGLLVEKENAEALKNAVLELIRNPDKRKLMGRNSLQMVRDQFSMERMIKNYERLFEAALPHPKKILHLISSTGLFGAEQIVLTLGQKLQDGQFSSIVGALRNGRGSRVEIIERARALDIETCVVTCHGRFDCGAVFRLKKYLIDHKVDILHTHNYKSDAIGLLAARIAGIPVMSTAHGFTDMTRSVSFYEKLDRWLLGNFFKKIVVVTEKMLQGFPEGKRCVIPNGVDIDRFSKNHHQGMALRDQFNVKKEDVLIGTVGRLSREKNQKMLLEALSPIMQNHDNVKSIIVGDGPAESALKQFSETRHLAGRVIFTGMMQDMVAVYSAIDIFVLSSLTEGVPLTVLEAMASKTPVVATRVGGIPDIVDDGTTGLLVEPNDTVALTERILDLITNRDQRHQLAEAAFHHIKLNYSTDRMCDAYRKIYGEI